MSTSWVRRAGKVADDDGGEQPNPTSVQRCRRPRPCSPALSRLRLPNRKRRCHRLAVACHGQRGRQPARQHGGPSQDDHPPSPGSGFGRPGADQAVLGVLRSSGTAPDISRGHQKFSSPVTPLLTSSSDHWPMTTPWAGARTRRLGRGRQADGRGLRTARSRLSAGIFLIARGARVRVGNAPLPFPTPSCRAGKGALSRPDAFPTPGSTRARPGRAHLAGGRGEFGVGNETGEQSGEVPSRYSARGAVLGNIVGNPAGRGGGPNPDPGRGRPGTAEPSEASPGRAALDDPGQAPAHNRIRPPGVEPGGLVAATWFHHAAARHRPRATEVVVVGQRTDFFLTTGVREVRKRDERAWRARDFGPHRYGPD